MIESLPTFLDKPPVKEPVLEVPTAVIAKETPLKTIPMCPYCGHANPVSRDEKRGYECPNCESVFLGTGTGVKIEHGVLSELANARNLPEELSTIVETIVAGPFRGNAHLWQVPEITLPSMAGVSIGAQKAGMKVERTGSSLFLTRE